MADAAGELSPEQALTVAAERHEGTTIEPPDPGSAPS
jgi:hypothetical protein